jgi:hypothetical protein
MFALCCAAPPGSTTVEIPPEAGNSAEALRSSDAKGMMSKVTVERSSNGARFDRFQQSDLVTPSWGGSEQPPGADVPAFGRQLSTSSYGSNLDGKSKEERLQELLREFRPMLAEGIRLSMVEVDTRLFSQCLFTLDMNSSTMHIVPAFGDQQAFDLKDITAIFKGQEFARKVPRLADMSTQVIGLEFSSEHGSPGAPTILHFQDTTVRNDFYACLRILRMTSEVDVRAAAGRR